MLCLKNVFVDVRLFDLYSCHLDEEEGVESVCELCQCLLTAEIMWPDLRQTDCLFTCVVYCYWFVFLLTLSLFRLST